MNNLVEDTSVTIKSKQYPLSMNKFEIGTTHSRWSRHLTGGMLTASITVSPILALPPQIIPVDSAASTNLDIPFKFKQGSPEAIVAFTKALQQRSYGLSAEDAQLLRQIVLAKSKPGIPNF